MGQISRRVMGLMLALDLVFKVLIAVSFVQMLGIDAVARGRSYAIFAVFHVLAVIMYAIAARAALHPIDQWLAGRDPGRLAAALRACWRAPSRIAMVSGLIWPFVILSSYAAFEWLEPGAIPYVGPGCIAAIFIALAVFCSAWSLAYALTTLMVGPTAREISLALTARGEPVATSGDRVARRLGLVSLCIGLGPTFWLASLATMSHAGLRTSDDVFAFTIGTFILAVAIYAPLCALVLGRAVADPMLEMVGVVSGIADGAVQGRRVPVPHLEEGGRLAVGLNDMIARLERAELDRLAIVQLERDVAEVREADRAKSEFLANMSHEIRTPMTAIQGFSDLLLDNALTASERLTYVQTIRRNSDHLMSLINDILDLSKIEAGRMMLETVSASPSQVVVDVASLMRVRAQEKGLGFDVRYLTPVPETISTDPTRLRQILINLVGNAIKFTESGGVRILVRCDAAASDPHIRFEVVDTGVGLSAEQIGNLFQRFVQADSSTTRRFGGSGLGLVICKRLSEMLGAEITVESVLGRGSTFTLDLRTGPLGTTRLVTGLTEGLQPVVDAPAGQSARDGGTRVLLAEDGLDNQRLIGTLLRKAGYEVVVAPNGKIAAEQALDAISHHQPFKLILMDMQMPELDGYGATSLLRSRSYTGPIVALTAHAMAGDRERCLAAGCDDYLVKPVHRETLLAMVARQCQGQKARPTLSPPEA